MDLAQRAELSRLLGRLSDGDRAAVDPAFVLLWPLLRAFCERSLGKAEGEDAAQAALVAVFARAAEFETGRDGAAWAVGIAAWQCRTLLRRRTRRREAQLGEVAGQLASEAASPEQLASDRELRAAMQEVLGGLRPLDVETLLAGGSGPTFRKRLSRALARFRIAWRARHGSD